MKVGVVIVTYHSAAEIGGCLDACLRHLAGQDAEIVVVDNASSDQTVAIAARYVGNSGTPVRLVANRRNLGFAGAVNQAITALPDCPAILLLNPDAQLATSIQPLLAQFSDPAIAAASGQLLDEHSQPQRGFQVRRFPTPAVLVLEALGINRLWPGNPINRRYRCLDLDPTRKAEVEQPAGAFLMLRRAAWEAVDGLNESFYPLWFEDVDLLKRLHAAGFRTVYCPDAQAHHSGGHSVARIATGERQLYWYGSFFTYAALHFSRLGCWAVGIAVILGSFPRALLGIATIPLTRSLSILGSIWRLAAGLMVRSLPGTEPAQFAADLVSRRMRGIRVS